MKERFSEVATIKIDPHQFLSIELQSLKDTILDEMRVRTFLSVDPDDMDWYKKKHLFGRAVCGKFNSATIDIEEAGKCLALDRGTACVFHLMRVLEIALRALGKSLNDPGMDPKKNPSWEAILRKCDTELQKPHAQRCPEWQSDPSFFATATANLRAVKDAWRNNTMHVEIFYTKETALDVWNTVKIFMRHLATKLTDRLPA